MAAYVGREVAGISMARMARHFQRAESTLVHRILALGREMAESEKLRRELDRLTTSARRQ